MQVLTETSFLYGANAAFVEDLRPIRPQFGRALVAFFSALTGRPGQARRIPPGSAPIPNGCRRSTAWPTVAAVQGIEAEAPGASAEDRAATLDSVRAIMMIRPTGCAATWPPTSTRWAWSPEAGPGAGSRDLRLLGSRLRPRSSSTSCWAWRPRRSARSCRSCAAPIAGPSASSSCTSPIRREGLAAGAHRRPGQGNRVHAGRQEVAILKKLIEAEGFEKFLRRQVHRHQALRPRRRRSLIPALEQIIKRGGALGVKDIVVGMPHRGRLNVLAR
jgi:2-oxoglutarate dehydrogenase E1 component